jgi:hypothetical protein
MIYLFIYQLIVMDDNKNIEDNMYNSDDDSDFNHVTNLADSSESDSDDVDGVLDYDSLDDFIVDDDGDGEMDDETRAELDKVVNLIGQPRLVMGDNGPLVAPDDFEVPKIPKEIRDGSDEEYILWIIKHRMGPDMTLEKYIENVTKKRPTDSNESQSASKKHKCD